LLSFNRNLKPQDGFLLLKGENFEKELEDARQNWHFDVKLFTSKTNEKSQILEIKNVRQKD
jgi:16S rRNA (guanine527-N7)-methyltransferase